MIEKYINKVTQGNCIELLKQLPDNCVDFCYADPPYGIEKAEWDYDYPIDEFEKELLRIAKRGIAITTGQDNIGICIDRMGKEYKGLHTARNLNGMTFNKIGFENTLISVLGGNIKRGTSFFEFVVKGEKPDHPSPKPLEFMEKIIERFTNEGDIVLDCYGGSGTTAVASLKQNRSFILFERETKYCAIANERIQKELNKLAENCYVEDLALFKQ